MSVRFERRSIWIRVGPWLGRIAWGPGWFEKSRHWSGWHRWDDPTTWGDC